MLSGRLMAAENQCFEAALFVFPTLLAGRKRKRHTLISRHGKQNKHPCLMVVLIDTHLVNHTRRAPVAAVALGIA